ncbi:hypothetical protein A2U01_0066083, partial [Trifolium medium]|nr:hypothetical protein [Trifolium medium]
MPSRSTGSICISKWCLENFSIERCDPFKKPVNLHAQFTRRKLRRLS